LIPAEYEVDKTGLIEHKCPLLTPARQRRFNDGLLPNGRLVSISGYLKAIVRAVYNVHFDEMAQSGKPIVSPWLVKWKKVAPPKTVQRELPHFTVAQMAAIPLGQW
jgi:hypothetical protein